MGESSFQEPPQAWKRSSEPWPAGLSWNRPRGGGGATPHAPETSQAIWAPTPHAPETLQAIWAPAPGRCSILSRTVLEPW